MIGNAHGPVVVGVDGSEEATRAAAYGAWEAKRRRVALRLVFAHQPAPMWGPATLTPNDSEWLHHWIHDLLTKAEKDVTESYPDVTIATAVIPGSPAAALVDESRHASLVVVGTRSSGGLKGHVAGSVAAQVAAHAHAPVVVLRPGDPRCADPASFVGRRVMVGLDGSPESQHALEVAVEEAVARDAGVHAVFVWSTLDVRNIGPIVESYLASEEEDKALRLVTEATQGWSEQYPDLPITHQVVHGVDPVDALTRVSGDAGLIVVGTRGRGGFLGLRLGSTSDGLIRQAGGTVMVVPGPHRPA
jgi:nucleotide-binding universal stress UspA family protein